MSRTIAIQTLGSSSVLACFMASELAAILLTRHPSSELAWFVNIEIFGGFEHARTAISPIRGLFGPESIWIAACLLLVTIAAAAYRLRLVAALIANLSFMVALSLGLSWWGTRTAVHAASLASIGIPDHADAWLVASLIILSAAAATSSHLSFVTTMWSEHVGSRLVEQSRASRTRTQAARSPC